MIKGKDIAKQFRKRLRSKLQEVKFKPRLAMILIGDNPTLAFYLRMKSRVCYEVGVEVRIFYLDRVTPNKLHSLIHELNTDSQINGILIEKPYQVPSLNPVVVNDWIVPGKDVDGTNSVNIGRLVQNQPTLIPCTAQAILCLLQKNQIKDYRGMQVALLGNDELVGKPLANILINRGAEVSVINYFSQIDLINYKLIIADTGRANLITKNDISDHSILVPVSEVRTLHGLQGDFTDQALKKARRGFACTGNVGPLTNAMLLKNVYQCYKGQQDDNEKEDFHERY